LTEKDIVDETLIRAMRRSMAGLSANARKKAQLIVEGQVHVPKGTHLPVFPIRSSGGPTSSRPHIVLSFGPENTRVKVAMGPEGSRFELRKGPKDRFIVLDNGRVFLRSVKVIPAVMHAPGQAFVNIDPTCDRGCLFCSADEERPIEWPAERWVKTIVNRYKDGLFEAVAITAGVPRGPKAMVERMIAVVAGVREALPHIPIGIEPNAVPLEALEMLRAAGADELKVNVQTATPKAFAIMCPRLDRKDIFRCLRQGVDVFGPGNVCSNIIIGLGETDGQVLKLVERLAKMGVVANIRALRINDSNVRRLEKTLGKKVGIKDPSRIEKLVVSQQKIFKRHGLDPRAFRTMCHRCACCDLTIGADL